MGLANKGLAVLSVDAATALRMQLAERSVDQVAREAGVCSVTLVRLAAGARAHRATVALVDTWLRGRCAA